MYAYWDRESHDLLYLGLAKDLPKRFAQHNGLVSHGGGNKTEEIDAYFAENEYLGLTVLIQSKAVAVLEEVGKLDLTLGSTADGIVAVGEGQLIEMHRLVHGQRPRWNRTGGSKDGKRWATAAPALLEILAARRRSLFVARRSLRELVGDLRGRFFEATIHSARMRAMMEAHEVGQLPADGEEGVRLISQLLMLRDGHIVQEFDASDDDIRRWLELLGSPDYWTNEAAKYRAMLQQAPGALPLDERDRAVADYLDSVIAQATPPSHIAATAEILSSGYLDGEPHVR